MFGDVNKGKKGTFSNKDSIPGMESITRNLIQEVTKPDGELHTAFETKIHKFSADSAPLGKEDAEKILYMLINTAVRYRNRMIDRVLESIVNGQLINEYRNRMAEIDDLQVNAVMSMKEMEFELDQYEYVKEIYEQVAGAAYIYTPDKKENDDFNADKDIMDKMRNYIEKIKKHIEKNKQNQNSSVGQNGGTEDE